MTIHRYLTAWLGAGIGALAACSACAEVPTTTPIKHLIVVVGENISFDNLMATWEPKSGAQVHNLLAQGIVKRDGSPGSAFHLAAQRRAKGSIAYTVTPPLDADYAALPQPNTTSASGLVHFTPDRRFPDKLPNGPFQITRYVDYAAYVGDPVHRFFQMWQQFNGGKRDLFVWVAETSGEGARMRSFSGSDTNQGGLAMGFYSMAGGDAPYFKELADNYAVSDNHHQPVMGGTGANFQALVAGRPAVFTDGGKLGVPPQNQIENPNPRPGTSNWYEESGYSGGSYAKCADSNEPGVKSIRDYLGNLPYRVFNQGNCEPGAYYLVNNYAGAYLPDGAVASLGPRIFRVPPQVHPTIADAMTARGVSWKWYSGGRRGTGVTRQYCEICDPLTFYTAVMTGPMRANLQDHDALFRDIASESAMPAVSIVIPPNTESGHPAYSTVSRFENFVRKMIAAVQSNTSLWANSAIVVTTDEGGGYWDSGAIQTIDFFGDGPRVPLFVVSPYARTGHVDHTYTDHASILKFIEANWGIQPLSEHSRDRLPNPVADPGNPYMPINAPAIGDLMPLFKF